MEIELIPVAEAARRAGVHVDTLYQAMQDNRLDYCVCDGKRVLFAEQVEKFAPAKRGRKPLQATTEEGGEA